MASTGSSVRNFLTQMFMVQKLQVRTYVRNFWSRPTAMPFPGHMHQYKRVQGHNVGQRIRISDERPSEIKRLRKFGYEAKMKYKTGRESIMENMLKGKDKYAEFF